MFFCIFVFLLAVVFVVFGKTHIFPLFTGREVLLEPISVSSFLNSFFVEFCHPYMSTIVAVEGGFYYERAFGDFFYWIIKPLKLFGLDVPDSVSYFNTYVVTGEWDSMIPPGGVAFSLQQGGFLFVPLFGFMLGVFYKLVDSMALQSMSSSPGSPVLVAFFSVVTFYFTGFVLSADIALIFQAFFVFMILFFALLFSGRVKIRMR